MGVEARRDALGGSRWASRAGHPDSVDVPVSPSVGDPIQGPTIGRPLRTLIEGRSVGDRDRRTAGSGDEHDGAVARVAQIARAEDERGVTDGHRHPLPVGRPSRRRGHSWCLEPNGLAAGRDRRKIQDGLHARVGKPSPVAGPGQASHRRDRARPQGHQGGVQLHHPSRCPARGRRHPHAVLPLEGDGAPVGRPDRRPEALRGVGGQCHRPTTRNGLDVDLELGRRALGVGDHRPVG